MTSRVPIILEKLPKSSDIPTWADYIELLCLINKDGLVTKSDILDRMRDEIDFQPRIVSDSDDESAQDDETVAENRDKEERRADDWFRHLLFREGAFNQPTDKIDGESSFYPFFITENKDGLKLKAGLTLKHKFYIFLLLASNLRYVPNYKHLITTAFEMVSQMALRCFLPVTAKVHIFGTSSQGSGRYSGNLWNKIKVLAKDLSERVLINEDTFSSHNSGDKGLDVVGWVPSGDETISQALSNEPSGQMLDDETVGVLLCVFAQCACTEEWVSKQHSSKVDAWRSIMTFTAAPLNMIFIPFCFRNSNGGWWQPTDIHQSIVVDRIRLVFSLRKDYRMLQELPIYSVIENILTYRESLV